jgi:DNA-binding FadR family transcriptional regulator
MSKSKLSDSDALSLASGGTNKRPKRPDQVARVTELIRQQILEGNYPAGHVMPAESKLAGRLSVSRNVVREAMRNLRTLGLVEVSQGRRPRVKSSCPEASVAALGTLLIRSKGSLVQLMELRTPLELQVVTLLAKRRPAPNLTKAAQTLSDMRETTDPQAFTQYDLDFHCRLAEVTGNPFLLTFMETLTRLTFELRSEVLLLVPEKDRLPDSFTKWVFGGHRRILEAIQQRDPAAAQLAMQRHLGRAIPDFRKLESMAGR